MEAGDYSSTITLNTNDPNNSTYEIPVTMTVGMPTYSSEIEAVEFGEVGFNTVGEFNVPITSIAKEVSVQIQVTGYTVNHSPFINDIQLVW